MRSARRPRRESDVRLYVEPMDATVVEVQADGRVRLENEEWSTPTLQERRAIIYEAEKAIEVLKEWVETLTGCIRRAYSAELAEFAEQNQFCFLRVQRVLR